jgi:hypothetical protein
MKKITLQDLGKNKNWEKAVIVFTEDSFEDSYTELERSYEVESDEKYFLPDMISNSLFGNCLDGKDNGVRLDIYMSIPEDQGRSWNVEYCYIVK